MNLFQVLLAFGKTAYGQGQHYQLDSFEYQHLRLGLPADRTSQDLTSQITNNCVAGMMDPRRKCQES